MKVPGGYPEYSGEALGHDTYVGLQPVTEPAAATSSGSSSAWIWAVVAAVVIVLVVIVLLVRRRWPEVEAGG